MPGKRITSKQAKIYMQNRNNGDTQKISAAKADISERSGRNIEHNLSAKTKKPRYWRTRKDPFEEVWDKKIVPLLEKGIFEATFLLNELQKENSSEFSNSHLRTLQRKIKNWLALNGPNKDVIFRQVYEPGKLGISDFTHLKNVKITINGEYFEHILYHFRLPYSGFNYMHAFSGSGEPYTAFASGLQKALQNLGGVPEVHRTDSLSASFKNLNKDDSEDLTERYKALAEHYGMKATRINPGKPNENGAIESSHRHVKNRIYQRLILRDSYDFASIEKYQEFIEEVVKEHNKSSFDKIKLERTYLKPLPINKAMNYYDLIATVSCTSTIEVKRVTYSVPSRLIGERLSIRLYHDKLEGYLGNTLAISFKRIPNPARGQRSRSINYRHFIDSLVKKPGAFRNFKFRDDLLYNDNYRYIWDHVNTTMNNIESCKFIVGVLHISATYNCEEPLLEDIIEHITNNKQLKLSNFQTKFSANTVTIPISNVIQHTLTEYNQLIPNYQGAI